MQQIIFLDLHGFNSHSKFKFTLISFLCVILLNACGGGAGGGNTTSFNTEKPTTASSVQGDTGRDSPPPSSSVASTSSSISSSVTSSKSSSSSSSSSKTSSSSLSSSSSSNTTSSGTQTSISSASSVVPSSSSSSSKTSSLLSSSSTLSTSSSSSSSKSNSSSSKSSSSLSSSSKSSSSSSSKSTSSSSSSLSSFAANGFYIESFEGSSAAGGGAQFKWSGGAWNFVVADAPKTGTKSLRFRYPAGANTSAEERFAFSAPHNEVWVRYWLKVPTNFEHTAPEPHWPTNNKLFALWMDDYSAHGMGPSVIWEYWDNGKGGSDLAVHYSEGNKTGAGPHLQLKPFIDSTTDKGRWMQIVLHVKAATINNAGTSNNDGLIETYRKWDGDSAYVKLHQVTQVNIAPPATGPNGWKAGYFMGWSNPGFRAQTDFYIDDIEFADAMNVNISTSSSSTTSNSSNSSSSKNSSSSSSSSKNSSSSNTSISSSAKSSSSSATNAPSITAVNISNGNVTVSGANFGLRVKASPFFYEDFDSRTTGSFPADFGYTNYGGFGGTTSVDQTNAYSGNKSLKHQAHMAPVSSDVQESFPHIGVHGFSSTELFISYKMKFNTNGGRIRQLKFNRSGMEVGNNWPCYNGSPKFRSSYYPELSSTTDKTLRYLQGGIVRADNSIEEGWIGETSNFGGTPLAIPENTWVQVEEYYRLNDIGQNNGAFITYVNGNPHFNRQDLKLRDNTNQVLNCSYLATGVDYLIDASSTDGVSIWYDDHYVDTTRARIVLANASSWTAATIRNPLPASGWSDTNASAAFQSAGFAANAKAWIFVINSNGQVSQGWAITVPATFSSGSSVTSSSSSSKSSISNSSKLSSSSSLSSNNTTSSSVSSSTGQMIALNVRVEGLKLGGELILKHNNTTLTANLNDHYIFPAQQASDAILDLQIVNQPLNQNCQLSTNAPAQIPADSSPVYIYCVYTNNTHITMPDTLPNTPINVSFDWRTSAFPGIMYDSRPGVIGGIFPYEYKIKSVTFNGTAQATNQFSLDFRRGTLRFTPSAEGTYVFTFDIKDSGSIQKSIEHTTSIQVSASNFLFVAPNGVDTTASGTRNAPYKTLDFAISNSNSNQIIMLRKGTYLTNDLKILDAKAKQFLAYPEEVATLDLDKTNRITIASSTLPAPRLEGIDIIHVKQYGIVSDPSKAGLIIRKIRFVDGEEGSTKSENPAFIHGWGDTSAISRHKLLIQDNDFGAYVGAGYATTLFDAGYSLIENNQLRLGKVNGGFHDKDNSQNNAYRENYIEFSLANKTAMGIQISAQDNSKDVHIHHNLLINAGIQLGIQCVQSTCYMRDHDVHHNIIFNGRIGMNWGPFNPTSFGTRATHNIINAGTNSPYGGLSCQSRPVNFATQFSANNNLIESSNILAFKDSECSGNDMTWTVWRDTYGMDTLASGSTLSASSVLTGSGPTIGLPTGNTRKTLRGHQY